MTRFGARLTSYKNDCVLCRQGKGIWRHPEHRRFVICDDCFFTDRHLNVSWPALPGAAPSRTTQEETHG
ncbi:hypothetical protein ACVJGD_001831 [Bradyrhizobium sp. USDA 10063]